MKLKQLYSGSLKFYHLAFMGLTTNFELFDCPDADGGLIGGASLVAADFITIATSY